MKKVYFYEKQKIDYRYFFGILFCLFVFLAGIYVSDYSMNSLMNSNNSLNIVRLQMQESHNIHVKLFNSNFTINIEEIRSLFTYLWSLVSAVFDKFNTIFFK